MPNASLDDPTAENVEPGEPDPHEAEYLGGHEGGRLAPTVDPDADEIPDRLDQGAVNRDMGYRVATHHGLYWDNVCTKGLDLLIAAFHLVRKR